MRLLHLLCAASGLLPTGLAGQSLGQRLATIPDGTVHLSFAARPGVCGTGGDNISVSEEDSEWEGACEHQPVRLSLELRRRQVMAVRTYVGGRWRAGSAVADLGMVRPQEAAAYLLDLAGQPRSIEGDPLLPATLADSVVVWPSLLRLARAADVPEERRRNAVFWLGQAAGAAVASALDSVVGDERGDREVRKQAVFALSQRSGNEGVPALIRIARTNPDPELRRTALFWLGQSEDPRVLALFEEILR
jgi:hypothetical protein